MKTSSLTAVDIDRLLARHQRPVNDKDLVPVHELFEEILRVANQFVPSEAGSVLLDDPELKVSRQWQPAANELVFVACFGDKAEQLIGHRIEADTGIVGRAYLNGTSCMTSDAQLDDAFHSEIDKDLGHHTRSIVCVPILIGRSTCGVLELINRIDRPSYEQSELKLLEIFAAYISTTLQNVLDSNRYREMAKRDDLTGLYNDRYFNQRLTEEVETAERTGSECGLIFLDLDHFKEVNDTHGHLIGSQTLREVGLILARTIPGDVPTVARYGGDEFVIIVPGLDMEATETLAEAVRTRIAQALFRIEEGADESGVLLRPGTITASIGVASYQSFEFPDHFRSRRKRNEFIRSADQAMYRAKALGKNQVSRGILKVPDTPTPASKT